MTEPNLRQHRLSGSRSYRLCRQISLYLDDYYLDGIIGLIPVAGSLLSGALSLVFVYAAVFKIRSWRLALVVLFNILKDLIIGLIPFLGNILDFFYKANKRNFALLDGFAAGDEHIVRQVNQQATQALIGLLILGALAIGLIYFTVEITLWLFAHLAALM
ncbi:DUF4112 domain-containing protein [Alysiella filiformis]|uniref:DUF4112 domain-containing protein n=1 Tax=Alysiella filiformis DSM 16848 TaxID=1120981 RepID=A0A286E5N0_9NEIS|nr:DUF4112 domain-containing protein [Alysiella filiformis]QMT30359.1 DUF4112 domain-containing protein [Alysiella filiformis]UBQ56664.1 DUF4112 domain-containing protein [Alysiella filiformis DSM 16848]SOD66203.1 protein of unknown function [Alysiella filiformis DSM 16848]